MLYYLVIIIRRYADVDTVKIVIMVVEKGDNEDFIFMMKELMRILSKIK